MMNCGRENHLALQTASVAVDVPLLNSALQTKHLQCRMCVFSPSTHLLALNPKVEVTGAVKTQS